MNKTEYGNYIRVNVSEDISSAVNVLTLTSPKACYKVLTITEADGLAVGVVNVLVDTVTFQAGEYVEYKIKDGDIDTAGEWTARLASTNAIAGTHKITDEILTFEIDP